MSPQSTICCILSSFQNLMLFSFPVSFEGHWQVLWEVGVLPCVTDRGAPGQGRDFCILNNLFIVVTNKLFLLALKNFFLALLMQNIEKLYSCRLSMISEQREIISSHANSTYQWFSRQSTFSEVSDPLQHPISLQNFMGEKSRSQETFSDKPNITRMETEPQAS